MISIDNDYYNIELYQLLVQLRNDIYEKTERALFKDIIKKSNEKCQAAGDDLWSGTFLRPCSGRYSRNIFLRKNTLV